jgi:excisionase family DNA binding protein
VSARLLDAKDVAAMLGVPVTWVREQTRAKNIPHVPLGRYRRYDEADILAWVTALKAGGGPGWRKHRPDLANDDGRS